MKADHVKKAYGDKVILHDINIDVSRGDRIAFVGRNGEGKTTLAKMLVGEEPLTAGHVTIGHNVKIGRRGLLVAQAGIAGSTELGDDVQVGGQSGFSGRAGGLGGEAVPEGGVGVAN